MKKKPVDLKGAPVLVAEDNPIIAIELADEVDDANGVVVGPATTVEEAEQLVRNEDVEGAVVGYQFEDGTVTGVADDLTEQGTPLVLQTGDVPPGWKKRFPKSVVIQKPFAPDEVTEALADLMDDKAVRTDSPRKEA